MLADVCRLCGRAFRYSRRKRRAMLEMLAENPVIFLTRKARSLAREFLSPIEHFIEYQDAPVSLPSGLAGIRAAGAPRLGITRVNSLGVAGSVASLRSAEYAVGIHIRRYRTRSSLEKFPPASLSWDAPMSIASLC